MFFMKKFNQETMQNIKNFAEHKPENEQVPWNLNQIKRCPLI